MTNQNYSDAMGELVDVVEYYEEQGTSADPSPMFPPNRDNPPCNIDAEILLHVADQAGLRKAAMFRWIETLNQ